MGGGRMLRCRRTLSPPSRLLAQKLWGRGLGLMVLYLSAAVSRDVIQGVVPQALVGPCERLLVVGIVSEDDRENGNGEGEGEATHDCLEPQCTIDNKCKECVEQLKQRLQVIA